MDPESPLPDEVAHLLDAAGFTEDIGAYAKIKAATAADVAHLYNTAYSAAEVREGMTVSDSRVQQRRRAHTLWAIDDGGTWVYPAVQFEVIGHDSGQTPMLKQVRGLNEVLPPLLARGLHPIAVAGFLMTPQPELRLGGQPKSVREWLLHGESVEPVLELIEIDEWATA